MARDSAYQQLRAVGLRSRDSNFEFVFKLIYQTYNYSLIQQLQAVDFVNAWKSPTTENLNSIKKSCRWHAYVDLELANVTDLMLVRNMVLLA
jgi:hypothetical protein